jgi:hypothetical protein
VNRRAIAVIAAGACACAFALGVAAKAGQRLTLDVRNETGSTLTALSLASGRHGPDLLEGRTVAPGEMIQVSVNGDPSVCSYDLTAAFRSGDSIEQDDVNLCELDDQTLVLRD